jgi:GTPase SAR1 family protein
MLTLHYDLLSRIGLPVCVNVCGTPETSYHAGFNVETVEYKNISFTVWDVGGQDKVRCPLRALLRTSEFSAMTQ